MFELNCNGDFFFFTSECIFCWRHSNYRPLWRVRHPRQQGALWTTSLLTSAFVSNVDPELGPDNQVPPVRQPVTSPGLRCSIMAGTQLLRELVNERLAVAAEQIFGLVEKTIAEYQEEVVRSKKEVIQLKKHLERLSVLKAEVILGRTGELRRLFWPYSNLATALVLNLHHLNLYRHLCCTTCVIKPVTVFPDSNSEAEDILPRQQSDQPPTSVEESEAQCSQHIKDELVDVSICPHPKAEASRVKDGYESGASRPTDSQRFSAFRVTLDDRWAGAEWNLLNCGRSPVRANSMEREQTFLEKRVCRVCGQIFSRDCDLIRHMDEIHMGERAFKCSNCDKEFARRNHLAIHLRIHTGERPHTCPFCKRAFAQRSNLNVHLRTHTGEKPYFCKSCGKMVAHSYHLKICSLKEAKGKLL